MSVMPTCTECPFTCSLAAPACARGSEIAARYGSWGGVASPFWGGTSAALFNIGMQQPAQTHAATPAMPAWFGFFFFG